MSEFQCLEVQTLFGWGLVRTYDGEARKLCIELEGFHGWSSPKKLPLLYAHLGDGIIRHMSKSSVGSFVRTKYGDGIVVNFCRQSFCYAVRLWSSNSNSNGSALSYLFADDFECIGKDEACDRYPHSLTREEAEALPTIELMFSYISKSTMSIYNKGGDFNPLEELNAMMMNLSDKLNSVQEGAEEKHVLSEAEEKIDREENEKKKTFSVQKVMEFLEKSDLLLVNGESKIKEYCKEKEKHDDSERILLDHWQKVHQTISDVQKDIVLLFRVQDQKDKIDNDSVVLSESESDNTSLIKSNLLEFLNKLREHIGKMRILFDFVDDRIEGLEMISEIIEDFKNQIMGPLNSIPVFLMEEIFESEQYKGIQKKIDEIFLSERKHIGKRFASILSKISTPQTELISSENCDNCPALGFGLFRIKSFRDAEDLLVTATEYCESSQLPGLAITSLHQAVDMEHLDSIMNEELDLDGLNGVVSEDVVSSYVPDVHEFRKMIFSSMISMRSYNSTLTSYDLRKTILEVPFIGLILIICHIYQAKDLVNIDMIKYLKDTIPVPLKLFLSNLCGEEYVNSSDILSQLYAVEGSAADYFIETSDTIINFAENVQGTDEYQLAMAHMKVLDINILDSTKNLAVESLPEYSTKDTGLLGFAEIAFTNEDARNRLVDTMKDRVLNFLISYIPTINITGLDGIYNDSVEYSISALDLSGFKLSKDAVEVSVKTDLSSNKNFFNFHASDITAKFKGINWNYKQLTFPHLSGAGVADAEVESASISLGFKIVRLPKGVSEVINGPLGCFQESSKVLKKYPVLAKQVHNLRHDIDINSSSHKNLSAWNSSTSVQSSTADIEIDTKSWEPVLILATKDITIETLTLNIANDGYAWIYNMLASIFSSVLKENICESLIDLICSSSSTLLGALNGIFCMKWTAIQEMFQFEIDSIPECSAEDFLSLVGPKPDRASMASFVPPREWTLKFPEEGPLGMKLDVVKTKSANAADATEMLSTIQVGNVVQNSQAERVLSKLQWESSMLLYASILTVNGVRVPVLARDEMYKLLSGPRPLFIHVRLSDDSFALLKEKTKKEIDIKIMNSFTNQLFEDGYFGLKLTAIGDGTTVVNGFPRNAKDNSIGQAEACGRLMEGMVVVAINGEVMVGKEITHIQTEIKNAPKPVVLTFAPNAKSIQGLSAESVFEKVLSAI